MTEASRIVPRGVARNSERRKAHPGPWAGTIIARSVSPSGGVPFACRELRAPYLALDLGRHSLGELGRGTRPTATGAAGAAGFLGLRQGLQLRPIVHQSLLNADLAQTCAFEPRQVLRFADGSRDACKASPLLPAEYRVRTPRSSTTGRSRPRHRAAKRPTCGPRSGAFRRRGRRTGVLSGRGSRSPGRSSKNIPVGRSWAQSWSSPGCECEGSGVVESGSFVGVGQHASMASAMSRSIRARWPKRTEW